MERRNKLVLFAGLVFLGVVAVISTALAFEHIGGYIPCKLCLAQRQPYYLAIPVAAAAFVTAWRDSSGLLLRLLFYAVGLLMLWTLALGVYHAGVEWRWWAGPADCGAVPGGIPENADVLLGRLAETRPPACDQASWRLLGLSFAGWNVVASGLIAIAAFAAGTILTKNQGSSSVSQ